MTDSIEKSNAFYECHGHIFMDGDDFRAARARHFNAPDEASVRKSLKQLQNAGCSYFRDGGDNLGVSLFARGIAAEYQIEYVSPGFAIHRKGLYGGIVGKSFYDIAEFRTLVEELKTLKADFLKLIVSGIITFKKYGELSCESIPSDEIHELINIAHGEGFSVMVHANGAEAITAASSADSIEHGYFCDESSLAAMADHECIWVPTLSAVEAFSGREGFNWENVSKTFERQKESIILARSIGVTMAPGSDSGAFGVCHGDGIRHEYELLERLGFSNEELNNAADKLLSRFRK